MDKVEIEEAVQVMLHTLEGLNERLVCEAYGLDEADVAAVMAETGTPAGWYPLIPGYDALPDLPPDLALPAELRDLLTTPGDRSRTSAAMPPQCQAPVQPQREVPAIKARHRTLYEAGPGASVADEQTDDAGSDGDAEVAVVGAYLPIPTEIFLEDLSQKLQIHPVSVYWLLQELRSEGARCKPEELRLLEDRLSVLVLRLLGHRWPGQLEAGEPVPEWADRDGIIPLLPGTGEATLADRLRERLRAEDGDLGAQQAEALLQELTGQNLESWLRRRVFERHVRQFKYRPIAWHLASNPTAGGGKRKGGIKGAPAFECLVYYHRANREALARIRTQYVAPLLNVERARRDAAHEAGDDTTAAQATARAQELERFAEALRGVEEQGFAPDAGSGGPGDALAASLRTEPLDRWSGDGMVAPADHDDLLARERAWAVDVNDGVRVNVAPIQRAGLLAGEILKEADARKAIADRARWRADERRWVREGVLPRCGWMGDEIPESPRWTERAPEREAERAKLEKKRAEALRKLEGSAERGSSA